MGCFPRNLHFWVERIVLYAPHLDATYKPGSMDHA
jgi:hypothetical protein